MFGPCKSSLTIAWLAEPIPLNSLLILFEPISGFDRMFIASSISLFSSVSLFECWREQHRLVSNTRERKKRQQQQQPTGCFFLYIQYIFYWVSFTRVAGDVWRAGSYDVRKESNTKKVPGCEREDCRRERVSDESLSGGHHTNVRDGPFQVRLSSSSELKRVENSVGKRKRGRFIGTEWEITRVEPRETQ